MIKEILTGVIVNVLTFILSIIIIGLIIYFGMTQFVIPYINGNVGGWFG